MRTKLLTSKKPYWVILLVSIVSLHSTRYSHAQVLDTIYYNSENEITLPTSDIVFYKVTLVDTITLKYYGAYTDYRADGAKISSGTINQSGLLHSKFSYYYKSGQLQKSGGFINGVPIGKWNYYYSNGQLKDHIYFLEDDFFIKDAFDMSGNKIIDSGNGEWVKWQIIEGGLDFKISGKVKGGKKNGHWRVKDSKNEVVLTENYSDGSFVRGYDHKYSSKYSYERPKLDKRIFLNTKPITEMGLLVKIDGINSEYPYIRINTPSNQVIEKFEIVDQQPEYPGGMHAFYQSIKRNLRFPKGIKTSIRQKVFVQFVVNQDGSLTDVEVVKSISNPFDKEAKRVVIEAGPWQSGKQKGKPVKVRMIVPITFQI